MDHLKRCAKCKKDTLHIVVDGIAGCLECAEHDSKNMKVVFKEDTVYENLTGRYDDAES